MDLSHTIRAYVSQYSPAIWDYSVCDRVEPSRNSRPLIPLGENLMCIGFPLGERGELDCGFRVGPDCQEMLNQTVAHLRLRPVWVVTGWSCVVMSLVCRAAALAASWYGLFWARCCSKWYFGSFDLRSNVTRFTNFNTSIAFFVYKFDVCTYIYVHV